MAEPMIDAQRRCPRCDRELVEVRAGDLYRTSTGAHVYDWDRHTRQTVCAGCRKAPAYCDCPVQLPVLGRGPDPKEGLSWISDHEAELAEDQGDEGAEG
jgi:hypothetical protein